MRRGSDSAGSESGGWGDFPSVAGAGFHVFERGVTSTVGMFGVAAGMQLEPVLTNEARAGLGLLGPGFPGSRALRPAP